MASHQALPSTHEQSPTRSLRRRALESAGFEVIPFRRTEQDVLTHVPKDIHLTVTASPSKGQDVTVDLATRLSDHGYSVAPHLSAQLIRDAAHLRDIVARCRDHRIEAVFVVGGDRTETPGGYRDALDLLRALHELNHGFTEIGIGGHPEGHPEVSDEVLLQALQDKVPLATSITTQIVFDPSLILAWARTLAAHGIALPIHVGVPGAVSRQKLIRVSGGLGIGESAKFLTKQQGMFWRFFLPGGYNPVKIITGLLPHIGQSDNHLEDFHVFTFNDLESTRAWRDRIVRRLA